MSAIHDLSELLAHMQPDLDHTPYVFCCVPNTQPTAHLTLLPEALASFHEQEGLTLVLTQAQAENAELSFDGVFQRITLTVHSSLAAVGLTAAVATALAEQGISANVIAAYYHDHIFVPQAKAAAAMQALLALQQQGEAVGENSFE